MEAVLLVIHLMIAIGIIVLVLIQPAESGGFLGGGANNMMNPRRKGDALTRATGIFATAFFVTSLSLAFLASHSPRKDAGSILDHLQQEAPAALPAPAEEETPVPAIGP